MRIRSEPAHRKIRGKVGKKLAENIEKIKDMGYPFTCKVFPDAGHGELAGEQIPRFADEVRSAHWKTIEKMA